jgi:hypothetical protein
MEKNDLNSLKKENQICQSTGIKGNIWKIISLMLFAFILGWFVLGHASAGPNPDPSFLNSATSVRPDYILLDNHGGIAGYAYKINNQVVVVPN